MFTCAVGNRMNEVMKLLTVISTILSPDFVAGIRHELQYKYPWNMPELNWYWGYPLCLAGMAPQGWLSSSARLV